MGSTVQPAKALDVNGAPGTVWYVPTSEQLQLSDLRQRLIGRQDGTGKIVLRRLKHLLDGPLLDHSDAVQYTHPIRDAAHNAQIVCIQ